MLSIAKFGFQHGNRSVRKGELIELDPQITAKLQRNGLVERYQGGDPAENPKKVAGVKSSASPAAPVSQPQTATKSETGGRRRRRRAASSSPTPPSD